MFVLSMKWTWSSVGCGTVVSGMGAATAGAAGITAVVLAARMTVGAGTVAVVIAVAPGLALAGEVAGAAAAGAVGAVAAAVV